MPRCANCGEEMIKGYIEIKGAHKTAAQLWVCPNVKNTKVEKSSLFIYCEKKSQTPTVKL